MTGRQQGATNSACRAGNHSRLARTSRRNLSAFILIAGSLLVFEHEAAAQERYDDHELDDRLYLALGGYHATDIESTLQVNSKRLGLGTLIDVENLLRVGQSVTVLRLDGFWRLNRANSIEWTYFDQTRNGTVLLENAIDIGDTTFPLGYRVDTVWKFRLIKASYAWSFINTAKYEFYLGAGLNLRTTGLRMRGEKTVGGDSDIRIFDESATLPLPTVAVGLRYHLGDRVSFQVRNETFFLEINDAAGRLQDNYFLVDYRIGERLGIGGGINFFSLDAKQDLDNDNVLKADTSHLGFQLFLSARF